MARAFKRRGVRLNHLLQPEIMLALGKAGHGSRVLIADGNYPVATECPPATPKVFLNLRCGSATVAKVLEVLVETIPIESVMVMEPLGGESPPMRTELRKLLPAGIGIVRKKRDEFYDEVRSLATTLIIATGEEPRFANILVTIGVVDSNRR
jgi:L-fucose mutarotase